MNYEQYVTRRGEVVELVGPMALRAGIIDGLFRDGWRVTSMRPYTNEAMWPEYDADRFILTANRFHDTPEG